MPFAFLIVGLVVLVSGVRGTNSQLATLVKNDFSGPKNYIYWMLSILIIGALGYIKQLEPLSRMFLVLVIIVLFLSNKGVFAQFNKQISAPATPDPSSVTPMIPHNPFGLGGTSGGAGATF